MQMVEVTNRKDVAEKKFVFSQSIFQTYFIYITNYADPDNKAMSLSEWMEQFLGKDSDKGSVPGETIDDKKKKIIAEAEENAARVMRAFTNQ